MSKNPQLTLNLGEENEIGFDIKIEGSDKELGSVKPKIRFALIEAKSHRGWLFDTQIKKNLEEGKQASGISVVIPDMKNLVSENEIYEGKLEVILGTRYFTPTEVAIKFVEPLKVEAAVVTVAKKEQVAQLNEQSAPTVIKRPATYSSLSPENKRKVDKIFLAECKKLGFDNPQKYFKDGTSYTKKRLRALIAKSVVEFQKQQRQQQ